MSKEFTAVSKRPDEELMPEWAEYIAMDSDGVWWAYSAEPVHDVEGEGFGDRSMDLQSSCVEIETNVEFEDYAYSIEKLN